MGEKASVEGGQPNDVMPNASNIPAGYPVDWSILDGPIRPKIAGPSVPRDFLNPTYPPSPGRQKIGGPTVYHNVQNWNAPADPLQTRASASSVPAGYPVDWSILDRPTSPKIAGPSAPRELQKPINPPDPGRQEIGGPTVHHSIQNWNAPADPLQTSDIQSRLTSVKQENESSKDAPPSIDSRTSNKRERRLKFSPVDLPILRKAAAQAKDWNLLAYLNNEPPPGPPPGSDLHSSRIRERRLKFSPVDLPILRKAAAQARDWNLLAYLNNEPPPDPPLTDGYPYRSVFIDMDTGRRARLGSQRKGSNILDPSEDDLDEDLGEGSSTRSAPIGHAFLSTLGQDTRPRSRC
ncbi:hypothetical protein DACRYDRAFT_104800 [Dacryopinax primogenitus]|uniref:Uncharacterized protein n=1 Tax=Dacryopinax primogenitus (strain DJM 731) TaxID=1858805 RepID=M5GDX4_DACPD|nr:uncharacterized protein DACRYDRAFT_104800 [Dacryopinax primogenitus]EJU04907.1 hypothetical protein DACRYDRAFT_104800 [Dacryopinax primogenitus]